MWPFSKPTVPSLMANKNQQVSNEIAKRTMEHKLALMTRMPGTHLNLLADGDSWFDYPLNGSVFGPHTDVIAQLPGVCSIPPTILNLAHYGYTSTQEMGYARQQAISKAISDPSNGVFDAILMSGGGNDIAGDSLCIWLNDAADVGNDPTRAVNQTRFTAAVNMVKASYLDLIALRDDLLPGAPIFVHDYDYAIPSGKSASILGVYSMGPWLKPSLEYCGWTDPAQGAAIIKGVMQQFAAMLAELASQPENNLVHVQTQGTTDVSTWPNELHPGPDGFRAVAKKIAAALAVKFPGLV
jgi:lysophospholipase L1-like esterase